MMKVRESLIANWSAGEFLVMGKRRNTVNQRERENYLGSFSSILKFSVLLSYLTSMYSFEKELKLKLIFFKS